MKNRLISLYSESYNPEWGNHAHFFILIIPNKPWGQMVPNMELLLCLGIAILRYEWKLLLQRKHDKMDIL